MTKRGRCYVELVNGLPVRVFRNRPDAVLSPANAEGRLGEWPRIDAVRVIRDAVYKRANGQCERCGKRLTWRQMHMDEKVSRGDGGEVAIDNCWVLCADCHILRPESEHGDRRWHSAKQD